LTTKKTAMAIIPLKLLKYWDISFRYKAHIYC
jgi:hypothetical protein